MVLIDSVRSGSSPVLGVLVSARDLHRASHDEAMDVVSKAHHQAKRALHSPHPIWVHALTPTVSGLEIMNARVDIIFENHFFKPDRFRMAPRIAFVKITCCIFSNLNTTTQHIQTEVAPDVLIVMLHRVVSWLALFVGVVSTPECTPMQVVLFFRLRHA